MFLGTESEPESPAPEPTAQPPSFIRPIANTMVTEGNPAKFEAVFSGHPTPEITWIRNGIQTLHDSKDNKVRADFNSASVSISVVLLTKPLHSVTLTDNAHNA